MSTTEAVLDHHLQTIAAVLECTSRGLLPEKYKTIDRSGLVSRLRELKAILELG